MAVTTSSGNGFALYNGVKLPNIDSVWDKSQYANATIVVYLNTVQLFLFNGNYTDGSTVSNGNRPWYYAYENRTIFPQGTFRCGFDYNKQEWVPFGAMRETTGNPLWTSIETYASSKGGDIYLAASDPIPLDGMTVIEWDGDTTGLDGVEGLVRIGDYIPQPTTGVAVLCHPAEPVVWEGILAIPEYGDDTWCCAEFVFGFSDNNGSGIPSGLYFASSVGLYTQLFAYPASSEPTYDRTAFLSGLAMGLCGKGNPTFEGSDVFGKGYLAGAELRAKRRIPVAYLYNGIRLPKLPEWDKETYPYAVILRPTLGMGNRYLYFSTQKTEYTGFNETTTNGTHKYYRFSADDNDWVFIHEYSGSLVECGAVEWANHDVVYNDWSEGSEGKVHLAASDPVPVYE